VIRDVGRNQEAGTEMPQPELRALFDQVKLDIAYHPAEADLDVAFSLYTESESQSAAQEASED
jgi:hypothetical protein